MHATAAAVRAAYDRAAEEYDRRWAAYTAGSLALLRPFLAAPAERLLDVGCGTGALRTALRAWGLSPGLYLGVDLSAGMLHQAHRGQPDAALVEAEAARLPLADGRFDLVVSTSSLHDWPDPGEALAEMRRVTAPGGRLLLLDWSADYGSIRAMRLWLRLTGRPVSQVFSARGLDAALRNAGFQPRRIARQRISPVWGLMVAEALPS